MTTFSEHNREMFDKHVGFFAEANYWRSDEEHAVTFLRPGKLLVGGIGGGRTVVATTVIAFFRRTTPDPASR